MATSVADAEMGERLVLLRALNDFLARPDMNPPRIAYLLCMAMTAGMADEHVRLDLSGYKPVTLPRVDGVDSDPSVCGTPQTPATVRIEDLMAYMSI